MGAFDFGVIARALPLLWEGMQITLLLTALGIVGGIALGVLLAMMRRSAIAPLRWFAAFYVDLLRSLPLVLLIFWFYFLVPLAVGHPVGGFSSAVIGFILFEGAYFCEIIRSGIEGVRRGQVMAGLASGFTQAQCMRFIVLPQAFRAMLPVMLMQSINVFKSTSLVYVIGLRDFLTAADLIGGRDNRLMEMYVFVAVVFFVICWTASQAVSLLQRRIAP
ncbi:amino acid ABC transporter permease [Bosea beijingensis]|uniref:amino acid ABC transporter permease n=1 Tax=Bosea beijingensis TaxID=3068632 RepID=UPI00274252CA|nr:amino acid ABC transporter permease [Bosea sp. REN20]